MHRVQRCQTVHTNTCISKFLQCSHMLPCHPSPHCLHCHSLCTLTNVTNLSTSVTISSMSSTVDTSPQSLQNIQRISFSLSRTSSVYPSVSPEHPAYILQSLQNIQRISFSLSRTSSVYPSVSPEHPAYILQSLQNIQRISFTVRAALSPPTCACVPQCRSTHSGSHPCPLLPFTTG